MGGFEFFCVRLKIQFREVEHVFMTIALPILLVVLNGSMSMGLQWFLPGGITMVILMSGFFVYLEHIVSDKERGIIRRMHVVPTSPATYMACETSVTLLYTFLSICILLEMMTILSVKIEGSVLSLMAMIFLGSFTFMALGSMIAGLIKSTGMAMTVSMLLLVPLMIFCFAPLEAFPSGFEPFIRFLPSVPLTEVMRDLVMGTGSIVDNLGNVYVMLGWLVGCALVAATTFRWE